MNKLEWTLIPPRDIPGWNVKLLSTGASYHQYPFWNEAFRHLWFKPYYLLCQAEGRLLAYTCVLRVGIPGCRIGLVQDGPVNLSADEPMPQAVFTTLQGWAKRQGFACLKFRCINQQVLAQLQPLASQNAPNPFPFYETINTHQLLVELQEDAEAMLSGFQRVARYEIRTAIKHGFQVQVSDDANDLATHWPLFQRLAKRKGLVLRRPLHTWMQIMQQAVPVKGMRLYTASIDGQVLQAILIGRGGPSAEYMLGALDVDMLQGHVSPSCLLHWFAMRDALTLGCRYYNLGTPSGPVYQFKKKFRPRASFVPAPVLVVCRRGRYRVWSTLVIRGLRPAWPKIRTVLINLLRYSKPRVFRCYSKPRVFRY